jgi:arylsulfatase
MTADVDVQAGSSGVIVAQGGRFGGFSFYLKGGKPTFTYNYLGLEKFDVVSSQALSPANTPSFMNSNPMADRAPAVRAQLLSMGPRPAKGELEKRSLEYSQLMTWPTLAPTTERR